MRKIWQMIAEIGTDFHPDVVESLATKLSSVRTIDDLKKSVKIIGSSIDEAIFEKLEYLCSEDSCLSPKEIAAALRGASTTATLLEQRENIQMVWTGPNTGLVASRSTFQVLLDVIESAESKLFMTSFVAYKIDKVMRAIGKAVEKGVRVDILLELSTKEGGKVDIDSVEMFRKSVPSAKLYTWKKDSESESGLTGVVHAKCAVADNNMAFITSANLTSAALEKNMELGVLFQGGRIPEKLSRHMEALVITGVIVPI